MNQVGDGDDAYASGDEQREGRRAWYPKGGCERQWVHCVERAILEDVRSGRTIVMQKMWLRYLACEELKQQAGVIWRCSICPLLIVLRLPSRHAVDEVPLAHLTFALANQLEMVQGPL